MKDKDYTAFPDLQALMGVLLSVSKYLNSFPYNIFMHLKSQTTQRSALLYYTKVCFLNSVPIRNLLMRNKWVFFCFDSFVQKNIMSRRWLSDDSTFLTKGRLCLFWGSFLVSEHREILLDHSAGGSPRLDSGPHSSFFHSPGVTEESKMVSPPHCATSVLEPPLLLPKAAKTRSWL